MFVLHGHLEIWKALSVLGIVCSPPKRADPQFSQFLEPTISLGFGSDFVKATNFEAIDFAFSW